MHVWDAAAHMPLNRNTPQAPVLTLLQVDETALCYRCNYLLCTLISAPCAPELCMFTCPSDGLIHHQVCVQLMREVAMTERLVVLIVSKTPVLYSLRPI